MIWIIFGFMITVSYRMIILNNLEYELQTIHSERNKEIVCLAGETNGMTDRDDLDRIITAGFPWPFRRTCEEKKT